MYVFTWPLPSQCPYQESSHFCNNSSVNLSSGGINKSNLVENTAEIENFESNLNSNKLKSFQNVENEEKFSFSKPSIEKFSILQGKKVIEDNDDIFEQPADIVRQIPVQVLYFLL